MCLKFSHFVMLHIYNIEFCCFTVMLNVKHLNKIRNFCIRAFFNKLLYGYFMKHKPTQLNIQPAFTLSLTIVWSLLEEYSCNHEGVDVSCHALSLGVSQSFQLF